MRIDNFLSWERFKVDCYRLFCQSTQMGFDHFALCFLFYFAGAIVLMLCDIGVSGWYDQDDFWTRDEQLNIIRVPISSTNSIV